MKRLIYVVGILLMFSLSVQAQTLVPAYHSQDFLLAPPGAFKTGLFGYDNPALLNYVHQSDFLFSWAASPVKGADVTRWGLFTASPHLGFGLIHQGVTGNTVTDYRLSLGVGDKTFGAGVGYGWSNGATGAYNRGRTVTVGSLLRPYRHVSLGLIGTTTTNGDSKEGVIDFGLRPLGNEKITLFTDYAIQNTQKLDNANWSAGAVLELLPGIRITGRYFDTRRYTFGLQFSLGTGGLSAQTHYDKDKDYLFATYGVRLGAHDRNILGSTVSAKKQYVELNLKGPIKYQRYLFFDKSNTLANLIKVIDAAKFDPAISGIAINTSGMQANREILWELREKLKDFKSTGKHVVIFIDQADINIYHFASIADKIVMDPIGMVFLQGFVSGRTFLKGALEKLGIGFDEWRFFKYKSAVESLSRDKMSEADREQRQKLVDDFYKLAKADITEGRNISPEKFDQIVNKEPVFLQDVALAQGLVDTVGRWETVTAVIKKLEGREKSYLKPERFASSQPPPDNNWGEKPRIAVIYALGTCAMDEGITARKLVKDVDGAVKDRRVKAIILRVDSPGGDPIASDYIAEALKKAKGKKPVIVSQGFVAGSGGYWLSMYGDAIVAAPNTITGSIGVIGGWFYNNGLKEKIGFSTDMVKAGDHSDLGFGFTIPILNLAGFPDRNLTTEERAAVEGIFKTAYKGFVEKVSSARGKNFDEIEAIAQGRVWSGNDGKQIGLVDYLGGLDTAIQLAKQKAGIPKDQGVTIVEMPKTGLFDPQMFQPKLFGAGLQIPENDLIKQVKFRMKHNGQPMPILPLDDMDLSLVQN